MVATKTFELYKKHRNGGQVLIHRGVDKKKSDYKAILNIANQVAKEGKIVQLLPVVHFKSDEYQQIYGALAGTKYDWKCPDLKKGKIQYLFQSAKICWLFSRCTSSSTSFFSASTCSSVGTLPKISRITSLSFGFFILFIICNFCEVTTF
jgi:hypothetical protein